MNMKLILGVAALGIVAWLIFQNWELVKDF